MTGYGQFCSMARAHEVLGGRWTLLIVREILCGSRRFNDIRRGIPRVSRTILSERLRAPSSLPGRSFGPTVHTAQNTPSPKQGGSWRTW